MHPHEQPRGCNYLSGLTWTRLRSNRACWLPRAAKQLISAIGATTAPPTRRPPSPCWSLLRDLWANGPETSRPRGPDPFTAVRSAIPRPHGGATHDGRSTATATPRLPGIKRDARDAKNRRSQQQPAAADHDAPRSREHPVAHLKTCNVPAHYSLRSSHRVGVVENIDERVLSPLVSR